MSRKSGSKWGTPSCGRCGAIHTGYSGKLDADDVEYVICGITNKRMNVSRFDESVKYTRTYPTEWVRQDINIEFEKL